MNLMNYIPEKCNEVFCSLVCTLGDCLANLAIAPTGCPILFLHEPETPKEIIIELSNRS